MRKTFFALALTALFSTGARAIEWDAGSFDDALERAKTSGRWMIVDVYATWCGPCHEMDEQTYARDEVGRALAKHFVALRRDGEHDGAELAKKYHVVGYPTLLVLDDKGAEVDRVMGFIAPKELIETLDRYRKNQGTLAELEHKLLAAPGDDSLRLEVGTRHAMRGDERAVAELETVATHDPTRAPPALLTLGKYYWLRGKKDYARAEKTLRELVARFPSSEEASEAPYNLALALHATGHDREARAALDAWVQQAPRDLSRYNAYAWLAYKENFDRARGIEVAKAGLAIDPRDHALWDTLGELYFAVGKADDARAAEKHALELKPKDAYYDSQLRRFGGKP